jgi:hypothetical protein
MMDFTQVHDRLMQAQRENPGRMWPELLLRKVERRAMILEAARNREARTAS